MRDLHWNGCAETIFQPRDASSFEFFSLARVIGQICKWISNHEDRFWLCSHLEKLREQLSGVFAFGNSGRFVSDPKKKPAGQNKDGDNDDQSAATPRCH